MLDSHPMFALVNIIVLVGQCPISENDLKMYVGLHCNCLCGRVKFDNILYYQPEAESMLKEHIPHIYL